jgi:hypothetical protein
LRSDAFEWRPWSLRSCLLLLSRLAGRVLRGGGMSLAETCLLLG